MDEMKQTGITDKKLFNIEEMKSGRTADGKVFIEGYANTKNKADRYGDVPTVFTALRNYVYELKEFKKNPVLLIDHMNSVENIAGSFSDKRGGYVTEDEVGLKFKAIFSDSDSEKVRHARKVYEEGHGKALSIGGRWYYEDKDNPKSLTYAEIFEISIVGVGADSDALTTKKIEKDAKDNQQAELEAGKAGRVLSKSNEGKLRSAVEALQEVLKQLEENSEEEEKCQKKTLRLTLRKTS